VPRSSQISIYPPHAKSILKLRGNIQFCQS
jgi:hypothetical protein